MFDAPSVTGGTPSLCRASATRLSFPRPAVQPTPFDRTELEALRPGLELLALRAFGDRQISEEVAQETLARAVIAAERGTLVQDGKVAAFVAGIARHVIADKHREAARLAPLSAADAIPSPAADPLERLLSLDERRSVHSALASLSAEDRELLRRCYFDGETPAEIADKLGEPPERIRKRKSRALDRLRDALAAPLSHVRVLPTTLSVPHTLPHTDEVP